MYKIDTNTKNFDQFLKLKKKNDKPEKKFKNYVHQFVDNFSALLLRKMNALDIFK